MAAHPVDQLVALLALAREDVQSAAAGLDQAGSDRRPAPDHWTPGEVLDHLAQSEAGTVRVLRKLLRETPPDAPPDDALPDQRDRLAHAAVADRSVRRGVPAAVAPRAGRAVETLFHELTRSRIELLDLARQLHGRDLRGNTFPHPSLGPLDAYQWLLFVAQHEARHAAQLREAR